MKYQMIIGNKTHNIEIPEADDALFESQGVFEYYLRRGNTIYLRNEFGQWVVSAADVKEKMKGIKYGTKFTVE